MAEPTLHIGRKISKIRELRGMKQETLAAELGISQQAVSKIEQSADVDGEALEKISKILGVPADAIKNFNDDAVLNIISNTFTSQDTSTLNAINFQPSFNPIDKIVELYNEKIVLLERLLQAEKEKNDLLKGK
ncbi:helix-turn-helix transcriptional regulator [Mucilaginibacter sp.]|jgi:transcriptional regulator with XRE-family HTH domain|uniref:helix-turn-helix domain-containing protein n=1 Tax=Mucilaginibacter sp. TaxID=1882438 RepID=UPI002CCB3234|nr:helix-turn-helix transcriptional regulator [Mucilaginibacter sp.]HTI61041.1 helix-turn-helix transcriptional regulator [Mucilaginibacter sp.]